MKEINLRSIAGLKLLDLVNRALATAVSVSVDPAYNATDRAWFRAPIKGGK